MKTVCLRAEFMSDEKLAHEYLQEMLGFPEYYGKNLDALNDCLTSLSDVEITIVEHDNLYWQKLKRVFIRAGKVNKKITISFL